jgi:tetratricopeptide (TPR) repeat protein
VPLPDLDAVVRWDERLRHVPTDAAAVERAIERAREELAATDDPGERCRLHGYLGNAARLLGRDEEALDELGRSLELADRLGDERARTVAAIRIGEAHRCFDRLDQAEETLRGALAGPPELRHFALQHLGKTLADAGRAAEAVEALEEALALRLAAGEDVLADSTRTALDRARRLHR